MKKYNIYCDESSVNNKNLKYMWIWAIHIEREYKNIMIKKINELKSKYNYNLEIKWRKVTPKTKDFYLELINLFFDNKIEFYSILIDKEKMNLQKYHNNDEELAFYKYYYFLLKNRFKNESMYYLYLDQRIKKDKNRIATMSEFFEMEKQSRNDNFIIQHIWEYDSHNHILIQLADFLTWAICYENNLLNTSETKNELIKQIIQRLWKNDLKFDSKLHDEKFNIFKIKLK